MAAMEPLLLDIELDSILEEVLSDRPSATNLDSLIAEAGLATPRVAPVEDGRPVFVDSRGLTATSGIAGYQLVQTDSFGHRGPHQTDQIASLMVQVRAHTPVRLSRQSSRGSLLSSRGMSPLSRDRRAASSFLRSPPQSIGGPGSHLGIPWGAGVPGPSSLVDKRGMTPLTRDRSFTPGHPRSTTAVSSLGGVLITSEHFALLQVSCCCSLALLHVPRC